MKILEEKIQTLVASKELVQVHWSENIAHYDVGIILGVAKEYFCFIRIDQNGAFDGVNLMSVNRLKMLKEKTIYLQELRKKLDLAAIVKCSKELIGEVNKWDMESFLQVFEGSKQMVGIIYQGEDFDGRVVKVSEYILVFDEYRCEIKQAFGRLYLKMSEVEKISVGEHWSETINAAMRDCGV